MNALIVNSSIKQTKKNEHGKLLTRISLNIRCTTLNCANVELSENEYDANFNTSKVYLIKQVSTTLFSKLNQWKFKDTC